MKNISEKLNISDNSYVVHPKSISNNLYLSKDLLSEKSKSKTIVSNSYCRENFSLNKNSKIINTSHLKPSDSTLSSIPNLITRNESIDITSALNCTEMPLYTTEDNVLIFDSQNLKEIYREIEEKSEKIQVNDEVGLSEIQNNAFSISDSVKIVENNFIRQEINIFQKDYVEIKSNDKLSYRAGNNEYLAVGELQNGIFKWYLNYDFPDTQSINIKYPQDTNASTNSNIFSSTQNIKLIYAKSELFTESNNIIVKFLPIVLDGTPIKKIKIDLNQNFINPIQKKYNFNPLYITGKNYTVNGNTINTYSLESEVRGNITFDQPRYIRNISYNGNHSLSFEFNTSSSIKNSNLYKLENIYISNEICKGKALPYKDSNNNYELKEIDLKDGSLECQTYVWKISGVGEWRNITLSIDNENGINLGNEIEIDNISYRYDCYNGWKDTNKEGLYIEFISDVSGDIDSNEENHEWGISESDGVVEFSVDNNNWFFNSRGLKGKTLHWRSKSEISYLIIWKNNNKEIVYENSGEIEINSNRFGGVCFEDNKELKVRVDDGDWIKIIDGNELNDMEVKKISWEYTGNKLIFIKDLSEVFEIESGDIENQGLHYGRISVFTTDNGKSNRNFYRLLGINDKELEKISINPIFSWSGKEDLYAIDFRKIDDNDFGYECGKLELNYNLGEVGKREYEMVFDSKGFDISNLGFIEYEEFAGNKEIIISNKEVVGIYFYDMNGNEFALTYDLIHLNDNEILVKFDENQNVEWNGGKVVVIYFVNKWVSSRFKAGLEKYDITIGENNNLDLMTVYEPLKAYIYNNNNEEIQLPIKIENNNITIDLSETDKGEVGDELKIMVLVKDEKNNNGLLCQKFNKLESELNTYDKPIISIYENKYLPNRIDCENNKVFTEFPVGVEDTISYVVLDEGRDNEDKILSKIWLNTTRKFNSQKNNFKTYVKSSDDLRYWSDWKEFNEDFDLCEYGKYFSLKTEIFAIEESDEKIFDLCFAFERLNLAKRYETNDKIYFSPNDELEKNTLYMIRVKSYNGVNYSEWSNIECYITNEEELGHSANNLMVFGNVDRQTNDINFSWSGEQNTLCYNNTTISGVEKDNVYNGEDLTRGKNYFWQIKDKNSKNAESNFTMNIKPPTPTFD